jgi:hypothetical protein
VRRRGKEGLHHLRGFSGGSRRVVSESDNWVGTQAFNRETSRLLSRRPSSVRTWSERPAGLRSSGRRLDFSIFDYAVVKVRQAHDRPGVFLGEGRGLSLVLSRKRHHPWEGEQASASPPLRMVPSFHETLLSVLRLSDNFRSLRVGSPRRNRIAPVGA